MTRHARAAFVEDVFSDEGGSLTAEGRRQAECLAEAMAGRRLAAVWCSDISRAVQTAEIVAAATGVAVTVRKALREVYVGSLIGTPFDASALGGLSSRWAAGDLTAAIEGGESGQEVIARHREVFAEIADLYRGETVLVVGHQTALGVAVPALAAVGQRPGAGVGAGVDAAVGQGPDPGVDAGVDAGVAAQVETGLDHAGTIELRGDADGWTLHPHRRDVADETF